MIKAVRELGWQSSIQNVKLQDLMDNLWKWMEGMPLMS